MTTLIETLSLGKSYGGAVALQDVSMVVHAGEVTCVLGDNGAGKSTLIKILSGVHQHDSGELRIDGQPTRLSSPRAALDRGIATVYQDLALVPLMSVWRNFVLGCEPTTGFGPLRLLDRRKSKQITREALSDMGIDIRDLEQPVGTLSGGQRQCIAIARAMHYGAKALILDEPTAALGVKQAGAVLRHVVQARDRGLGVILITHNPHHAYPVGNRFLLLERGTMLGTYEKPEIDLSELTRQMAGGAELNALQHELQGVETRTDTIARMARRRSGWRCHGLLGTILVPRRHGSACDYKGGDAVPALNVQFTDAEMELVRAAASRSGKALKPFAHDVILSAADDRADRVAEAFEYVTARSTELNRRLE